MDASLAHKGVGPHESKNVVPRGVLRGGEGDPLRVLARARMRETSETTKVRVVKRLRRFAIRSAEQVAVEVKRLGHVVPPSCIEALLLRRAQLDGHTVAERTLRQQRGGILREMRDVGGMSWGSFSSPAHAASEACYWASGSGPIWEETQAVLVAVLRCASLARAEHSARSTLLSDLEGCLGALAESEATL